MTVDVIETARRRSRRLLLLVVAATAALTTAVCVAGLGLSGTLDATPAPTDPATTGITGPASPAPDGVSVVLPVDVTWVSVAGVALPVSPTAGPRRRDGGLASGFAHTPAGALLAAVHLLVRTTPQVGADVFAPTLDAQVVGEHAAAMRAAVDADYRTLGGEAAGGAPVGVLTAALAGARITAYTDSAATVDLLTVAVDATGTARFAASLVELTWTGADWALLAPPGGRWDTVVRPVTPAQAATYPPLAPGR
jgi:hypothetical protein